MANDNLGAAKKAKNDEFYTQYADIQKEIGAYLMYDPNTFKDRVVYCNCDDPFESNFFRYFTLNFKRLGLKRLITTSYKPSPIDETQLVLTGIIEQSAVPVKGRKKPQAKRFIINDVGDYNGDGTFNNGDIAEQLKANKNNEWETLKGDKDYPAGDFRSAECVELLKQSDIVVTNPPFSLSLANRCLLWIEPVTRPHRVWREALMSWLMLRVGNPMSFSSLRAVR